MTPALQLLRPRQWVKNTFVFFPIFFGGCATDIHKVSGALLAFAIFTLAASGVYCLNDMHDVESDRKHHARRLRPLASGAVTTATARALMVATIAASLTLCLISPARLALIGIVATYIVLNIAYTYRLKRVTYPGVAIVAFCYVLRVALGGVAADIRLSPWIIVMTFVLALLLTLGKRYDNGNTTLRPAIYIVAVILVVGYVAYTISPEVTMRLHSKYVWLTSICVITAILRYIRLIDRGNRTWAPTQLLLSDRIIQACVVAWIIIFTAIIY